MKKKLFLLQFLFVIFFACSGYAQQNDYTVNFKNVPMKDFITFVSEFTGKNVIYNEADLRGNVTISSQKNMDSKEILDIFYSVMKLNGYHLLLPEGTLDYFDLVDVKERAPREVCWSRNRE